MTLALKNVLINCGYLILDLIGKTEKLVKRVIIFINFSIFFQFFNFSKSSLVSIFDVRKKNLKPYSKQ